MSYTKFTMKDIEEADNKLKKQLKKKTKKIADIMHEINLTFRKQDLENKRGVKK